MVNTPTPDPLSDPFEGRSRELFEASVERLDARTRSRLNQARQRALQELNKGSRRRYWLGLPLGGLAASALVALVLIRSGGEPTAPAEHAGFLLDDVDIVADADNFDMIRDVEFYSWLGRTGATSSDSTG